MIEKYYGVHVKNSLNAAAINVVRSGKDVMAEEEVSATTHCPFCHPVFPIEDDADEVPGIVREGSVSPFWGCRHRH
jgi:hypothetical protein